MEFFRQLLFTRQSTDSIHEEQKANRPSINESNAERITGVKRVVEEVVEDDTVGDDPEIVVNLHKKNSSSRQEESETLESNPPYASCGVSKEKIALNRLTSSPRSLAPVKKLKYMGESEIGEPVYRVWYMDITDEAPRHTDVRTYSDICSRYSHLGAMCDKLKENRGQQSVVYRCRGNGSLRGGGPVWTDFRSKHLSPLNGHYHDLSRFCAPFAYFNVRKPSTLVCEKILKKLKYAEECSLSMLAVAVFETDRKRSLQKFKKFPRKDNIDWILQVLPTGMYLLADGGHVVSVDIKENRIDSIFYDSAAHRPKEFSRRTLTAAGMKCVDKIRLVYDIIWIPKL